jgi:GT2 family glycosyltransferase
MTITFFIINFKADRLVRELIDSIKLSKRDFKINVDVHIIDNSLKNQEELRKFKKECNEEDVFIHANPKNVGYFGAIPKAQQILKNSNSNCVVYCNPDLKLDSGFFKELLNTINSDGIIAPAIISLGEGVDQNPKYVNRLSFSKLRRLKFIYSNHVYYTLFFLLARLKEITINRIFNKEIKLGNQIIYAPHGSMIIFNNISFFTELKPYPCFLFGEEIFIAEEAKIKNIRIFYKPEIKVFDVRHASINLLSAKHRREMYLESINYILKEYY